MGVTTVGEIREAGGYVAKNAIPGNPYHCLVGGLTADVLRCLLTQVIPNPRL